MPKDYAPTLATAKRLVRQFGRQVTLRKLDNTSSNPSKPWLGATNPATTATLASVYAVAVPPIPGSELGFSAIPDDLLKSIEQMFIVEVGETTPEALDTYTTLFDSDSKEYRIIYVEKLKPANLTLLYFIGVAR
jgi:hypothetical protein